MKYYKERFYEAAKPFFDAGVMHEIYSSDRISICNVANVAYYVFYIEEIPNIYPVGFMFTRKDIKDIIEDETMFFRYFRGLSKKDIHERCLVLGPDNMPKLLFYKEKFDREGPGAEIDLEMEAALKDGTLIPNSKSIEYKQAKFQEKYGKKILIGLAIFYGAGFLYLIICAIFEALGVL